MRNWDYRYCWLRDSAFVVRALNRLGATRTHGGLPALRRQRRRPPRALLQPLYGIGFESELAEEEVSSLAGYRGMGPVRRGNLAWLQQQHDVYGSVVLAATQLFFDQRLDRVGDAAIIRPRGAAGRTRVRIARPARCRACGSSADAPRSHTYSSVMCWAACDRLAKIADPPRAARTGPSTGASRADECMPASSTHAYNEELGHFVEALDGNRLDASLLLLADLGFVKPEDPRFVRTVEAIGLRPQARRRAVPLRRPGRLRLAGNQLHDLHVLVHRRTGRDRPAARRRGRCSSASSSGAIRSACFRRTWNSATARPGGISRRPIRTSA